MRRKLIFILCLLVLIPLLLYFLTTKHSVSASLNFITKWGADEGYTGGSVNGKFRNPNDVAVDSSGDVYVIDYNNNRIQELDSSGAYVRQWGTSGSGQSQFFGPAGIAIATASGKIYVTDSGNARVEEFDTDGTFVRQWGTNGGGNGQFFGPEGIAVDSSGNVYVADTVNNRVEEFDSSGNYIISISGFYLQFGVAVDSSDNVYVADTYSNIVYEYTSGQTGAIPITSWSTVNPPYDIVVDSAGNVYTSDNIDSYAYNEIEKHSNSGTLLAHWGTSGTDTGQFDTVKGLGIDSSDNIYVADSNNNRIQKFDSSGNYLSQLGYSLPSDGNFHYPQGISVDTAGDVYVADTENNRIQKFDNFGTYLAQWGTPGTGNGQFNNPYTLASSPLNNNVYVVDSGNNRIQEFNSGGTFIKVWGTLGTGNGQFNAPEGIAFDSSGNVYVSDTGNNRIQKFDSNGNYLAQWGSGGSTAGNFSSPVGITIDSAGNVYVSDSGNSRVQRFNTSGGYTAQWGGSGSGIGQFNGMAGIGVDPTGNVYVVDSGNNRIQEFSSSGIFILSAGSSGSGNGAFSSPSGIAFDSSGNLFVIDTGGGRVEKFSVTLDLGVYFSNAETNFYRGDDNVRSLLKVGSTLYLGGNFGLEAVDLNTGQRITWSPVFTGGSTPTVYALAYSPANNILYAGGTNGLSEYDIATGTGILIPDFSPAFAQDNEDTLAVYALKTVNNTLYVGGSFSSIDSNPRINLASYDISTSAAVLTSWQHDTDSGSLVDAFATSSAELFAGGSFSTVDGLSRTKVAAFDLTTGNLVDSFVPDFDAGSFVRALEYGNDKLYVGGQFGSVDNQPFNALVSLTATGEADLSWTPSTHYPVYALAIEKNYIYAGEGTVGEGNYAMGGYAEGYNLQTGNSIDWYAQDDQPVLALITTDEALYAGLGALGNVVSGDRKNTLAISKDADWLNIVPVAQAAGTGDSNGNLLADIGGLTGSIYLAKFDAIPPVTPTPVTTSTPTPTPTSGPGPTSPPAQGPVNAAPCSNQKPGNVQNLLLTAGPGTGQVTLSWDPPEGPVTDYSITYSNEESVKLWGVVSTGNATTYTVSGLPMNNNYYFWVNAVNGCMPGDAVEPEIHLGPTNSSSYTVSTGYTVSNSTGTIPPPSPLPPTGPEDTIKIGAIGVIFTILGGALLLAL